MLPVKSKEDIVEGIVNDIHSDLGIDVDADGSFTKSLIDGIGYAINDALVQSSNNTKNSFFSNASGSVLDAKASIIGLERNPGESDADFKSRANTAILNTATANETAIKSSLLEIADIKEVIIDDQAYGAGSFIAYIVTDELETPAEIVREGRIKVKDNKATGIMTEVMPLKPFPVDITYYVLDDNISNQFEIKEKLQDFLDDNLRVGNFNANALINKPIMEGILENYVNVNIKINNNNIATSQINFKKDKRPFVRTLEFIEV